MEISKELLNITVLLLPGIVSFLIIETLIPYKKVEFNRTIIYVISLSALSFFLALIIWKLVYFFIALCGIDINMENFNFKNSIFSYHSNFAFSILIFIVSILIGIVFVFLINKNIFHKLMNILGGSNKTSNLDVWNDFFQEERENTFVVIRDMQNDIMYYGAVKYYSIASTSKNLALHLVDVDVFINSSSKKLYDVKELYLPFIYVNMTIEFPNFKTKDK